MDLLSQYKVQHPEAFREKPKWKPPSEYGFFIRLVMRLSGGRIREARQASYVLLMVTLLIGALTVIVWLTKGGGSQASFEAREFSKRFYPQ